MQKTKLECVECGRLIGNVELTEHSKLIAVDSICFDCKMIYYGKTFDTEAFIYEFETAKLNLLNRY
jgi:hypothetical protein